MADERGEKFSLTADQVNAMLAYLAKAPRELLLSEECRRLLAHDRWSKNGHLRIHEDVDSGVMPGTVEHNRRELEQALFGSSRRTLRLINPLSALEPIYSFAGQLKVLSIGPRTEMELFHLMGVGFSPKNIHAVDLIASSPLMDTGDMHKLPYPDQSFHVVISSWVLGYSRNPQLATDEMLRVTAHGGLAAIGLTYDPASDNAPSAIVGCNYGTADELKGLFGPKLGKVHFEQDMGGKKGPVMLIATVNHGQGA